MRTEIICKVKCRDCGHISDTVEAVKEFVGECFGYMYQTIYLCEECGSDELDDYDEEDEEEEEEEEE